jgi:coenzyme F420-dependent glucose-6-phosphate dehydrogenase
VELGYSISCEEHRPLDIVRHARLAEEAGLGFALISDHFHPWTDSQGQSPFVWSVIGAIAARTERLRLGTGVTCPLIRIHPAIVAQAAATSAAMMPGRFFLGVGTGENLNEHVTGERWPAPDERIEMLEEAIVLMRQLWEGGYQTFRGDYYDVDHARIYTLPEEPIPIAVAAAQPNAAELAGRLGDALVSTAPDAEVTAGYRDAGGDGPRYGQVTVCWHEDEAQARRTALEIWPNAGAPGRLSQELPLPSDFESVAELVTEEQIAEQVVCGPDPEPYLAAIRRYAEAGFDHVYIHQVGADQEGFLRFWERELRREVE